MVEVSTCRCEAIDTDTLIIRKGGYMYMNSQHSLNLNPCDHQHWTWGPRSTEKHDQTDTYVGYPYLCVHSTFAHNFYTLVS